MIAENHLKFCKPLRLRVLYSHIFDHCRRLHGAYPFKQCVYVALASLAGYLHRAVVQAFDVPRQVQPDGKRPDMVAEPHALHQAAYRYLGVPHGAGRASVRLYVLAPVGCVDSTRRPCLRTRAPEAVGGRRALERGWRERGHPRKSHRKKAAETVQRVPEKRRCPEFDVQAANKLIAGMPQIPQAATEAHVVQSHVCRMRRERAGADAGDERHADRHYEQRGRKAIRPGAIQVLIRKRRAA